MKGYTSSWNILFGHITVICHAYRSIANRSDDNIYYRYKAILIHWQATVRIVLLYKYNIERIHGPQYFLNVAKIVCICHFYYSRNGQIIANCTTSCNALCVLSVGEHSWITFCPCYERHPAKVTFGWWNKGFLQCQLSQLCTLVIPVALYFS